MPFVPVKNRENQSVDGAQRTARPDASRLDTSTILAGAGEVAFVWTIASDALTWDASVLDVLGVPADRIATGRGYAALLDPQNRTSRQDAILRGRASDQGSGVRYEVQYALLPDGPRGRRLIVEDVGRWHADAKGRPARVEGVVRVINDRHEREQRLLFLSRYDELTGYLNRQSLLSTLGDALNGAIKGEAAIAFMIIAVDNFGAINQAYGFDVADQVFASVAQRIRSTLRDGDTIGRFGGNKLGVVLRHCDDADMPSAAERFQAIARNDLIALPGGSVAVTVSCGGVSLPRHGRSVSDAVTRAQEALHIARATGPGKFAPFNGSKELNDRRRRHAAASADIVAAFNANRFVLAHQPVVDAPTRRLAFSEACLRIERGESADTSAAEFAMPAEGLGLSRLIDARALDLALGALERTPQATLSLKVSGETIGDAADAAWLKRLAGKTALAARLIVEIAGRAMVDNARETNRFAGALHDLGCAIAVGSLGDGYPSRRGLRDLKVDFLKIDGSTIASPAANSDDQALVRALAELGRAFGARTVAERVSDDACAALLTDWGIDYLQGGLIGEAVLGDPPAPSPRD